LKLLTSFQVVYFSAAGSDRGRESNSDSVYSNGGRLRSSLSFVVDK